MDTGIALLNTHGAEYNETMREMIETHMMDTPTTDMEVMQIDWQREGTLTITTSTTSSSTSTYLQH